MRARGIILNYRKLPLTLCINCVQNRPRVENILEDYCIPMKCGRKSDRFLKFFFISSSVNLVNVLAKALQFNFAFKTNINKKINCYLS